MGDAKAERGRRARRLSRTTSPAVLALGQRVFAVGSVVGGTDVARLIVIRG